MGRYVTRRLTMWVMGLATVVAGVVLVGCLTGFTPVTIVGASPKHAPYAAGTACDAKGCHDSYKHQAPYLGPCEECHGTSSWKNITYTHKDPLFDNGMHPVLGCTWCHVTGQPLPAAGCAAPACHAGKAPHGGWLSCGGCHTTLAWSLRRPAPATHLSLAGGHAKLTCLQCHNKAATPVPPRGCVDCHGVHHGGLRDCAQCHDPAGGWNPKPGWDHDRFFPIVGAHTRLQCTQCHLHGRFAGTPRWCSGCHGSKHGGLTDCGSCHTTSYFKPSTFSHSSVWPRTGAHAKLACTRCHPGNKFAQVKGTHCVDCHGSHHGGLTACGSCHTTTAFIPAKFNHNSIWPRTGAHAKVACARCHPNGRFAGTPRGCSGCHGSRHGGLTACASCHTTSAFIPSTFKHSTVFVLVGMHATTPCYKCHVGNLYANVRGTHCVDCHGVHHGNQTQCQDCHTPAGWSPTKPITHPAPVVLGPGHAWPKPCIRCHPTLIFNAPTRTCETCHGLTVPHTGPAHCTDCHRPTTWTDVHFTHPTIPGDQHDWMTWGPYPIGCNCHPGTARNFTVSDCTVCHATARPAARGTLAPKALPQDLNVRPRVSPPRTQTRARRVSAKPDRRTVSRLNRRPRSEIRGLPAPSSPATETPLPRRLRPRSPPAPR
jgi:hypothetical protein